MKVLNMTSGLSTPAPAIAGPEIPIPIPAPMAERRTLSPPPRPAQNVGHRVTDVRVAQSTTWLHSPTCRVSVGSVRRYGSFIRLAKPFNPVKHQSLHKNDQTFPD